MRVCINTYSSYTFLFAVQLYVLGYVYTRAYVSVNVCVYGECVLRERACIDVYMCVCVYA